MTTKLYIKLPKRCQLSLSIPTSRPRQYPEPWVGRRARTKAWFIINYGKWLNEICKNEWTCEIELNFESYSVKLKPYLVFKTESDAVRFKLEWEEECSLNPIL